jgi:putative transposase
MPGRLRRHDEHGHVHFLTFSCYRRLQFFRHESVKEVMVDAMIRTRAKLGIRRIGYVIMPEHVHLLVFPVPVGAEEPVPISQVLHHVKQYAGRQGKGALRSIWREHHTLGALPMDRWALGSGDKPFWKTRGYDFNVTTDKTLRAKLDYMHRNPVTRGLVDQPEQWAWSSYRYYELDDDSLIAMDWDGSWPIV